MASIVKKSLNQPEEIQTPEKLKSEIVTVDGFKIQRITAEPGWRWTEHLKPIFKTDTCQKHHILYIISGKLGSQITGEEEVEFTAGDVAVIPPGHDGWTVGDTPVVWLDLQQ